MLSVILPARNEEKNIGLLLEETLSFLQDLQAGFEILIIDDDDFLLDMYVLKFKVEGLDLITADTFDSGRKMVAEIKPDRIGHGVMAARDPKLMKAIVKQKIVLEICPTSNLRNSVVKNAAELKTIVRTFKRYKVRFTINTDGPEMYRTNIHKEQEFLIKNKILSSKEVAQCTKWAFEATFIN